MVFSSVLFLFGFLPLALLIYYVTPSRWRNLTLLLTSLFFYAWGEPLYILLMVFSTLVDYSHGLLLGRLQGKKARRLVLFSSICINVGLLAVFKYSGFLLENLAWLLGRPLTNWQLPLPLGISFYTFQTMSYTIDVYRGKIAPQKNLIDFGAYVSLFPQLIAGPIVRYESIAGQLRQRPFDGELLAQGIQRLLIGLSKKVLLANNLGLLFDVVRQGAEAGFTQLSVAGLWLGIVAFGLQIYFDFSGYSDMAIGLGMLFGFRFPGNFNYPYCSKSIGEFWRRWHISLGSWFREYVYIPLGGNRVKQGRLLANLLVVWGLTGLWHGASWNFLLWGLYFGFWLVLEKFWLDTWLERLPAWLAHLYTLLLIAFSWVLFAFEDLSLGLAYSWGMVGLAGLPAWNEQFLYLVTSYALVLIIAGIATVPWAARLPQNKITSVVKYVALFSCFFLSVAYLVDGGYNPFLYFRF